MSVKDSISYPFDYWGGIFQGSWIAVPTTLESNVIELHAKMFDQVDYIVSDKVKEIS